MNTTVYAHPGAGDKPSAKLLKGCVALDLGSLETPLSILLSTTHDPATTVAYLRVLAQVATDSANEIATRAWKSNA